MSQSQEIQNLCDFSHKDIEGWTPPSCYDLYSHVVYGCETSAKFVEVGVCFGKSAAFMAEQIKESGKQIEFYAVDIWQSQRQYEKFVRNMFMAGVNAYIKPIRCPSVLAAKQFEDESLSFVYVDADHKMQAVMEDIWAWLPKVKPGCILAGDDFHMNTVRAGVANTLGLKNVDVWGRCWVYHKKGD